MTVIGIGLGVEWLRERVDRDYPLAYARPFLAPEGKEELLVAAQVATGLDEELWMVVPSQQGVLLTPTSRRFTDATYYPDLEGPAEHIIADPATPAVWLHPLRRQGQPTVNTAQLSPARSQHHLFLEGTFTPDRSPMPGVLKDRPVGRPRSGP